MSKTVLAGAVAFGTLAVVLVLGTQVLGVTDSATPFITTILGFFGLAVSTLIGSAKAESADNKVNELNADLHNGTFRRLLREALKDVASEKDNSLSLDGDNGNTETNPEGGTHREW